MTITTAAQFAATIDEMVARTTQVEVHLITGGVVPGAVYNGWADQPNLPGSIVLGCEECAAWGHAPCGWDEEIPLAQISKIITV